MFHYLGTLAFIKTRTSNKLGKIGLIKWVDKRQITSTKGLESWRFKCYSLHQFTLIKLICWKPNFHVALSHRHSTTVSLEIKHFFSILLCELSPTSPEVVFIFNAPLIITKALGGLLQAKSHWLRTIKKMFIEMEMVNRSLMEKFIWEFNIIWTNYLRIL